MIAPLTLAGKLTQVATPEPKYVSTCGFPLWDDRSSSPSSFLPKSTYQPNQNKKKEGREGEGWVRPTERRGGEKRDQGLTGD